MTAQVIELLPTGERADETVRATIKGLIEGRRMSKEEVAADDTLRHAIEGIPAA